MNRWRIFTIGCAALAQQIVVGDASALVLVLHRHDNLGIHGHLVSSADVDPGRGNSIRFAHESLRKALALSENLNVIGVFTGCHTFVTPAPSVDSEEANGGPGRLVDSALAVSHDVQQPRHPFLIEHAHRLGDGDDVFAFLLTSNHALLI